MAETPDLYLNPALLTPIRHKIVLGTLTCAGLAWANPNGPTKISPMPKRGLGALSPDYETHVCKNLPMAGN
jgi:hypothetical protein